MTTQQQQVLDWLRARPGWHSLHDVRKGPWVGEKDTGKSGEPTLIQTVRVLVEAKHVTERGGYKGQYQVSATEAA